MFQLYTVHAFGQHVMAYPAQPYCTMKHLAAREYITATTGSSCEDEYTVDTFPISQQEDECYNFLTSTPAVLAVVFRPF